MAISGTGRFRGVTVVPQTPDGLERAFRFDAVTDMAETNPGQAFRHPIQNGAEGITDATRLGPPGFTCSGLTSNTPVSYFTLPGERATELYELIKSIRREQIPVTVLTSWLPAMENRWPEMIEGRRGQDTGQAIEITLSFVKFRFSTLQLIPSFIDSDVLALGASPLVAGF